MHLLASILGLAALANAHFVLNLPTSLGWDDDMQGEAPCGGFNVSARTNVTQYSLKGGVVSLITTHDDSKFQFRAAKLSDLKTWVNLTQELHQTGEGDFCEPGIPGPKGWAGQDAVLQIIQDSVMGTLYQCAAVKFVDTDAAKAPSACVNSTEIKATWM